MAVVMSPGHGEYSLGGDLPDASPTAVDTTITISPSGKVEIDMSKPVKPHENKAQAECLLKKSTAIRLCLVPQNAGSKATLGNNFLGDKMNPDGYVEAQGAADFLNGGSGPACGTFYKEVDPSVPGTTIVLSGEKFYIKDSCGVAVGPAGLFSPGNVELLPDGSVRLHYRPGEDGKWAGAEIISFARNLGYGELIVTMDGIPSEQTREEKRIIRSPFRWSDLPLLAYLKPGEIFGWPLKEEWGNIHQEFDLEFGLFGDPNRSPAQFAVQHWNIPGNVKPIYPNTAKAMIFNLAVQNNSATFRLTQDGQETVWPYTNTEFIPQSLNGGITFNIWNSVYKAKDSTTHAPSNGIRQSITIRSVKFPPANVPLPSASPTVPPGQPGNTSLPPASPTGAPGSGASSAMSAGMVAGIAVAAVAAGVGVVGVVAKVISALRRRAAAEPPREVAPAPLNEVVIELSKVGDAELHRPEISASPQGHDQVVEGAESQQPETRVPTPVDNAVVVELQVVAALQQPEISVSPHVPDQVAELPVVVADV